MEMKLVYHPLSCVINKRFNIPLEKKKKTAGHNPKALSASEMTRPDHAPGPTALQMDG